MFSTVWGQFENSPMLERISDTREMEFPEIVSLCQHIYCVLYIKTSLCLIVSFLHITETQIIALILVKEHIELS